MLDHYEPKRAIIDALFNEQNLREEFELECHRDHRLMTILWQDMSGGLEIKYKGDWYPVVPMEGHLGINIGKILGNLSDGKARCKNICIS